MNLKNSVIKWLHTLHVEPLGYLALRARIGRLKIFDVRGTLPIYFKWFVYIVTLFKTPYLKHECYINIHLHIIYIYIYIYIYIIYRLTKKVLVLVTVTKSAH